MYGMERGNLGGRDFEEMMKILYLEKMEFMLGPTSVRYVKR
jgi:hypothetical protein